MKYYSPVGIKMFNARYIIDQSNSYSRMSLTILYNTIDQSVLLPDNNLVFIFNKVMPLFPNIIIQENNIFRDAYVAIFILEHSDASSLDIDFKTFVAPV